MKISEKISSLITEAKRTPTPLAETSNLYTELGFDSLAFVELLLKIEEACSISFELMEMETCLRIDKLIALAESKAKENEGRRGRK